MSLDKKLIAFTFLFIFFFYSHNEVYSAEPITCGESRFSTSSQCITNDGFVQKVNDFITIYVGNKCFSAEELISDPRKVLKDQLDLTCNMFDSLTEWIRTSCGCDGSRSAGSDTQGAGDLDRINYVNVITDRVVALLREGKLGIGLTPTLLPTLGANTPAPTLNFTPTPTPRKDAINLARNISGNCGYAGGDCCDVDIENSFSNSPPSRLIGKPSDGDNPFEFFFDFVYGVIKPGFEQAQADIASATDGQIICAGNLNTTITTNDGSTIEGVSTYDLTEKMYFIEISETTKLYDYCKSMRDEIEVRECIQNRGRRSVDSRDVLKCACTDRNNPQFVDPQSQRYWTKPEFLDKETDEKKEIIYTQICASSLNPGKCLNCVDSGSYWQGFLPPEGQQCIADKSTANINLRNFVRQQLSPENVLSATTDLCGILGDDWIVELCAQCVFSGNYWSGAGCTNNPLQTSNAERLCQNLPSTEKISCEQCFLGGEMWTAFGCVPATMSGIINEWLIGIGLGIAGAITLLCVIYAAFLMQTSAGEPEKVTKAQELLTSCIVGLMVVIFATFIVRLFGIDLFRIPGFVGTTPNTIMPKPIPIVGSISISPSPLALTPVSAAPTLTRAPTPTIPLPAYSCGADPEPNEVYLYDNENFDSTGPCLRLTASTLPYNLTDPRIKNSSMIPVNSAGIKYLRCSENWNDCIKSIKVGSRVSVVLYEHQNTGGVKRSYKPNEKESSIIDLGDKSSLVEVILQ